MKYKSYSILYLVVTIFYLLRPLSPYFEYVIDRDNIEKHLCVEKDNPDNSCHGKCYLDEQLSKSSGQMNGDSGEREKRIPDNRMDDHLKVLSVNTSLFQGESTMAGYFFLPDIKSYISKIFVPPQE